MITLNKYYDFDNVQLLSTLTCTAFLSITYIDEFGQYMCQWSSEIPTTKCMDIIPVDIAIDLISPQYGGHNGIGKISCENFAELLPTQCKRSVCDIAYKIDIPLVDGELQYRTGVTGSYSCFDRSYLTSMSDDQLLQHAILHGNRPEFAYSQFMYDIECVLSSRGKRFAHFRDGSINKIVKAAVPKPTRTANSVLTKKQTMDIVASLGYVFSRKVSEHIGLVNYHHISWRVESNSEIVKSNKKFMISVGWTLDDLCELGVELKYFTYNPTVHPEIHTWWDSIVVD